MPTLSIDLSQYNEGGSLGSIETQMNVSPSTFVDVVEENQISEIIGIENDKEGQKLNPFVLTQQETSSQEDIDKLTYVEEFQGDVEMESPVKKKKVTLCDSVTVCIYRPDTDSEDDNDNKDSDNDQDIDMQSPEKKKVQADLKRYYNKDTSPSRKKVIEAKKTIKGKDNVVDVNVLSDKELLVQHFNGQIWDEESIDNWDFDPTFINMHKCPVPKEEKCAVCLKLCFSKAIRGQPHKTLDWFRDVSIDCASEYHDLHFHHIRYKFLRFCLGNELKLRNITRAKILDQILTRFRGHYDPNEIDDIDFIMNLNEWYDFKLYLDWKERMDYNFHKEWLRIDLNNFYCTGCGLIARKIWDAELRKWKQICSEQECPFEHIEFEETALINPRGSDEERHARIERAIERKRIPEEGHQSM